MDSMDEMDRMDRVEEKFVRRSLPCPLTREELLEYADRMARATQQVGEVQERRKEVTAQLQAEEKAYQADVNRLSTLISTRTEWREIECVVRIDREVGRKSVIRTDTGAIVEMVAISTLEL